MWTALKIRRHINTLGDRNTFSTQEVLDLGDREEVDKVLGYFVKTGVIDRVTDGVFCLPGAKENLQPKEVAQIKATAFGKKLFIPFDYERKLREAELQGQDLNVHVFYTDGNSTSFKFGEHTIHLKRLSPRRLKLGNSKAAQALRSLWELGPEKCDRIAIRRALINLTRRDLDELDELSSLCPAWLSKHFDRKRNSIL